MLTKFSPNKAAASAISILFLVLLGFAFADWFSRHVEERHAKAEKPVRTMAKVPSKPGVPQKFSMQQFALCRVCGGRGYLIAPRTPAQPYSSDITPKRRPMDKHPTADDFIFYDCEHCTGMVPIQRF